MHPQGKGQTRERGEQTQEHSHTPAGGQRAAGRGGLEGIEPQQDAGEEDGVGAAHEQRRGVENGQLENRGGKGIEGGHRQHQTGALLPGQGLKGGPKPHLAGAQA